MRGGGCSGWELKLTLDEAKPADLVFEDQRLIVDEVSHPFVEGSTVDYKEGLQGAGFSVTNPNATASCGCGSSFTT